MAKLYKISMYVLSTDNEMFDIAETYRKMRRHTYQFHCEESKQFDIKAEENKDLLTNTNIDLAKLEDKFDHSFKCDTDRNIVIGGKYKHFKEGKVVEVVGISRNTEHPTEKYVVYRCEDDTLWCRPLDMFLSEVDKKKYPYAKQKYRFELVQ